MRLKGNVIVVALLGVSLTACAGQTFTKQVTEVRSSYAKTWDDRMTGYRDELSAAGVPAKIAIDPKTKGTIAPGPQDFDTVEDTHAPLLGRFDTLVAFKAFRHAQPVMSVAQKWVVVSWQTQFQALANSGVREDEISDRMKQLVSGKDFAPVGDAEVDYRLGVLSETRLLTGELVEFNRTYHTALRSDIANLPPQTPPPTAAEMQGIINGITAGARIGAGLGR
tara:strand:- start:200952 stop:201620 length:669 start_codon:yes stop_codon:yes gene_type:complete